MNRRLFAKALAAGVEAAYSLDFDEALADTDRLDLTSGDVEDAAGEFVHWTYVALQVLDESPDGRSVEIVVSAMNADFEERVHVYVRDRPREKSVIDREELDPEAVDAIRELGKRAGVP